MKKKELISKLEVISGELDSIPGDSSLLTIVKDIRSVMGNIDGLINDIEEDGIDSEE